jgi:glycosyltransferase involved in cell wall biosynthesis
MSWPSQAAFLAGVPEASVIYEMIDDHSLMPSADEAWFEAHRYWVRHAGGVAASAEDLLEEVRKHRPEAVLVPNAVRVEDWSIDVMPECPADMLPARGSAVVLGYYGALASWFDWELIEAVAMLRPDWSFVLIGFAYDIDLAELKARLGPKNIHFLGPKPYDILKDYVAHFDVATIPFKLNKVTHACSPVKLFEYMAAGKPIVTTPMREVLKYPEVLTASTAQTFVEIVERALERRNDPAFISDLRNRASSNTWRQRAQSLLAALPAFPAGSDIRKSTHQ